MNRQKHQHIQVCKFCYSFIYEFMVFISLIIFLKTGYVAKTWLNFVQKRSFLVNHIRTKYTKTCLQYFLATGYILNKIEESLVKTHLSETLFYKYFNERFSISNETMNKCETREQ